VIAVNPSGEQSRCESERPPASTDMSIWASRSIEPSRALLRVLARASSTSVRVRKRRKSSASSTIISRPPGELAGEELPAEQERDDDPELDDAVRRGEPERPRGREVSPFDEEGTGEHNRGVADDDDAPSNVARESDRGESSGSSRRISRLETTACTIADSVNPRIWTCSPGPSAICSQFAERNRQMKRLELLIAAARADAPLIATLKYHHGSHGSSDRPGADVSFARAGVHSRG
jgi:hypothetical protein